MALYNTCMKEMEGGASRIVLAVSKWACFWEDMIILSGQLSRDTCVGWKSALCRQSACPWFKKKKGKLTFTLWSFATPWAFHVSVVQKGIVALMVSCLLLKLCVGGAPRLTEKCCHAEPFPSAPCWLLLISEPPTTCVSAKGKFR